MLEICNASGGYRKTVIIRDVDLEVGDGEVVALLGRNGVGKTTLIKYAMAMITVFSGTVRFGGQELPRSTAKRAKAGLGYVPQGRRVFPRLTVAENIFAAAAACGHDSREELKRVLDDFPILAERTDQLAGSLSGGQQQILAIGRALATRPQVLLLDEPTEGVQPSIVDQIAEILRHLNEEYGIAVLLAEQNLDFALSIAGRAYVMDKGTIAQIVTREQLLGDTALLHELLGV
ncbi:MAG: ABC transporter ATP-binding protein [Alphaproteobacteria bacterium]|nr:ABC transporter ATP-binding protein [Alphaproteobacteria bacterium]